MGARKRVVGGARLICLVPQRKRRKEKKEDDSVSEFKEEILVNNYSADNSAN
jgi:hypothetical protein